MFDYLRAVHIKRHLVKGNVHAPLLLPGPFLEAITIVRVSVSSHAQQSQGDTVRLTQREHHIYYFTSSFFHLQHTLKSMPYEHI